MGYLAFPLRFRGSLLQRCDPVEAVVFLVESMARTPHGSWAGSESFGVRDLLAEAPRRPDVLKETVREMNRALADLGIDMVKVDSIQLESGPTGESRYLITLSSAAGPARTHSLRVKQPE
jgi:hypothetical protein